MTPAALPRPDFNIHRDIPPGPPRALAGLVRPEGGRIVMPGRELRRERGFAMLFIGHDLDAVAAISKEIAVMHEGRIVEKGRACDIIDKPNNPYTRALVEAMLAVRLPPDLVSTALDATGPVAATREA